MVTTKKNADAIGTNGYRLIGTRPIRPDGTDKVTGRAAYAADTQMEGLLFARLLRSPHGHAKIKSIDASQALALDGVEAVLTAADFPGIEMSGNDRNGRPADNQWLQDNILASDKVRTGNEYCAAHALRTRRY